MTTVYLSLGSNLDDRLTNLKHCVDSLKEVIFNIIESNIIETEPQYFIDQPFFLNQVIKGDTFLSPQDLLIFTQAIEKNMGRSKGICYGPRIIDIDIISYDDLVMDSNNLVIPHPLFFERLFVLKPLKDIAPDWTCPKTGHSVDFFLKNIL
jgi:2-amino-4-hydroxy-6-hydroxymethyldihydropteridine diphosphokinase